MLLEQLLTSNDFKKTMDPYHVRYKCCFCGEQKYKLYVHKRKRVFICHKCGMSGRLSGKLNVNLDEFQNQIERFQNGELPEPESQEQVTLPANFITRVRRSSGLPYQYLKQRQVTEDEIERYRIGYCTEGQYAERIIVPVYRDGALVYFVARTYTDREPRYLNVGRGRNRIIFKTFEGQVEEAIIVEGIFDAIRVGKVKPAIAILGKVMGDLQAEQIAMVAKRAVVVLDQDAPMECFRVAVQLSHQIPTRQVFINRKDPGSMTVDEVNQLTRRK